MIPKAIQQWGRAPTPLVPKSVLKIYGYLDAPQSLKNILGSGAKLSDLNGDLWDRVDAVSGECLAEIVELLKPHYNSFKHLHIYSGEPLNRSVESLPFSTRTKNAVVANPEKFSTGNLVFCDVLAIPSFGVRSAIEFACVLESVIDNSSHIQLSATSSSQSGYDDVQEISKINSFFQLVSAWAHGEQNIASLQDALPPPIPEWPPEIKEIWSQLGCIESKKLAGDAIQYYSVPKLVKQQLGNMDERLLDIAVERIFAIENTATLEDLGSKFKVTRERVRQLEKKAFTELDRFKGDDYLPVLRRAQALGGHLGRAIPRNHPVILEMLNWVVEDFKNEVSDHELEKSLFLWLAGPYEVYNGWLIKDREIQPLSTQALLDSRDSQGVINLEKVNETLNDFGIKLDFHAAWLDHLQVFLKIDDGLIYFHGSILDKAFSLLKYFAKPMAVEEMLEYIGSDNVRSVRQRLIEDSRFWRINKQNEFVLAGTDGFDEYTGITDEIVQEIELCGGEASYSHLIEKLSRIYGVKENSVIAYLSTPMFTKDKNGMVRVRNVDDVIDVKTDLHKSAACYLSDGGTWVWRTKIDKDAVRGSGRMIPNSFAQEIGCDLGDKVDVPTDFGDITVSWSLSSTTGAHIGSLRHVIDYYGADVGDYLFVKASKPEVSFSFLKESYLNDVETDIVKLALILGNLECKSEDEALSKIAISLGVSQVSKEAILNEARQKLISRGEKNLSNCLEKPKLSVDDYIDGIGQLFK